MGSDPGWTTGVTRGNFACNATNGAAASHGDGATHGYDATHGAGASHGYDATHGGGATHGDGGSYGYGATHDRIATHDNSETLGYASGNYYSGTVNHGAGSSGDALLLCVARRVFMREMRNDSLAWFRRQHNVGGDTWQYGGGVCKHRGEN